MVGVDAHEVPELSGFIDALTDGMSGMAMAKTLIKSRAYDDASTASILTHINDELSADNEKCMFVTIFAAIINITDFHGKMASPWVFMNFLVEMDTRICIIV